MLLKQARSLDRALIAAVDEDHTRALELHKGDARHRLSGSGGKRRHFRSSLGRVGRPTGALAQIDEPKIGAAILGHFAEKRLFLRAADRERRARARECAEPIKFRAAELAAGDNIEVA